MMATMKPPSGGHLQPSVNNTTDNDPDMRASSGSPVTMVTEFPVRPDISMFCDVCQCHIELRGLLEHRYYHKCLQIMKYRGLARPENTEKLMQRRQKILSNLKRMTDSDHPLDPRELQHVNEAYEFLKADLEDTYEAYRRIRDETHNYVSGIGLNCSADSVLAVGICSHGNDRWKNAMEDTRVFQDYFGNDSHKCFFALYDGHHGTFAADMAAQELHHALLLEMEKFDPRTKCACTTNHVPDAVLQETPEPTGYCELHSRSASRMTEKTLISQESTAMIQKIIGECEEKLAECGVSPISVRPRKGCKKKPRPLFWERMCDALAKAHLYTDLFLVWGKDEHSRVRWSGCSTLAVVVQDTIAGEEADNVPSRPASAPGTAGHVDHFPAPDLKQLGVIHLANAGNVRAVLVRGNLPYRLSKDHTGGNLKEKTRIQKLGGVVSETGKERTINGVVLSTRGLGNHGDVALKKVVIPDPHTTNVPIDQYAQFLILATHGVWEVFSDKEAASILLQMIPSNYLPPPSCVSFSVDALMARNPSSGHPASRSHSVMTADITAATEMPVDPLSSIPTSNLRPPSSNTNALEMFLSSSVAKAGSQHLRNLDEASTMVDMATEVGSQADQMSEDGDIDTITELSLPERGPAGTRDEMLRHLSRAMAERLTQAALLAGSRNNISVMVLLLPGCGL